MKGVSSFLPFHNCCQPPPSQGLAGSLGCHVLKLPLALVVYNMSELERSAEVIFTGPVGPRQQE